MFNSSSPPSSDKASDHASRIVSRRRFGRDAVLAGALSLSSVTLLTRAQPSEGTEPTSRDFIGPEPDQAQEVEAKLSHIIRKYGDRLSHEQREHLRRILTYNEKMLVSVRTFPVQNGDPPASVLRFSFAGEAASPESPRSFKNKQSRSLDETQQETS